MGISGSAKYMSFRKSAFMMGCKHMVLLMRHSILLKEIYRIDLCG